MLDSDQIKKLLKKNLETTEECHRLVKKLYRAQTVGRIVKLVKWALIIAIALGAYYYVQPFMETFWQTIADIREDFSGLQNAGEGLEQLQGFFKP